MLQLPGYMVNVYEEGTVISRIVFFCPFGQKKGSPDIIKHYLKVNEGM
jgi:hypothetical protein